MASTRFDELLSKPQGCLNFKDIMTLRIMGDGDSLSGFGINCQQPPLY